MSVAPGSPLLRALGLVFRGVPEKLNNALEVEDRTGVAKAEAEISGENTSGFLVGRLRTFCCPARLLSVLHEGRVMWTAAASRAALPVV